MPPKFIFFDFANTLVHQSGSDWQAFEDIYFLSNLPTPAGIISNWGLSLSSYVSKLICTKKDFMVIMGSEECGFAKPDSRFFIAAMQKLKLAGLDYVFEDCMMVGDSLANDIEPAHQLGMQTVLIDRQNYFPQHPGNRIQHLDELAKFI